MSRVIRLYFNVGAKWSNFIATQPTDKWARDDVLVIADAVPQLRQAALWDPATGLTQMPPFSSRLCIPLHVASRYKSATAHFASALANNSVAKEIVFYLPASDPCLFRYMSTVDARCYMYELTFGGAPRCLQSVRACLNGDTNGPFTQCVDVGRVITNPSQRLTTLQARIDLAFDSTATIIICATLDNFAKGLRSEGDLQWTIYRNYVLTDNQWTCEASSSCCVATLAVRYQANVSERVSLIKRHYKYRRLEVVWDRFCTLPVEAPRRFEFMWYMTSPLRPAHQCMVMAELALRVYLIIGAQDLLEVFVRLPDMYGQSRFWLANRLERIYKSIRRAIGAQSAPARCTRSKTLEIKRR